MRSKRSAVAFAQASLARRWADLAVAAFAERARTAAEPGVDRGADPLAVAETLALGRWEAERAARWR